MVRANPGVRPPEAATPTVTATANETAPRHEERALPLHATATATVSVSARDLHGVRDRGVHPWRVIATFPARATLRGVAPTVEESHPRD